MDFTLLIPRDKLTTMGGGVYAMDDAGELPHRPNDYSFPAYFFREAFGKAEAEEVAARLVTLCKDIDNSWAIFDYNVFRRMVIDELDDHKIQDGVVFSLVDFQRARYGSNVEDWINAVIDVGLNWLRDNGFIEVVDHVAEDGLPCSLIKVLPRFFEPIERFVPNPAA